MAREIDSRGRRLKFTLAGSVCASQPRELGGCPWFPVFVPCKATRDTGLTLQPLWHPVGMGEEASLRVFLHGCILCVCVVY